MYQEQKTYQQQNQTKIKSKPTKQKKLGHPQHIFFYFLDCYEL